MLCRRSERQPRNVYPAGRKRQEKKNKVGGRREEPPCSIQAQTTSSLALLYIYTELVAAELPGKGLYCVRANTQKFVSSWIKSGIILQLDVREFRSSKYEKCCGNAKAISFKLQQYTECLVVAYLLEKSIFIPAKLFYIWEQLFNSWITKFFECFTSHEYYWKDFSFTTSYFMMLFLI